MVIRRNPMKAVLFAAVLVPGQPDIAQKTSVEVHKGRRAAFACPASAGSDPVGAQNGDAKPR